MTKELILSTEGLTLKQAAKLLGCNKQFLLYDVALSRIPCGVFAKGWQGVCFPESDKPIEIRASNNPPQGEAPPGLNRRVYIISDPSGDDEPTTIELLDMYAAGFWYLDQASDAVGVVNAHPDIHPIRFLIPWRGHDLHKANPDSYPEGLFRCYLYEPVNISTKDLIFLYDDIAPLVTRQAKRWPWGSYSTEELEHLDAAVREFWVDYDPANPSSLKESEGHTVKEWLTKDYKEKTGATVTASAAERIATIIRPEALKKGGRRSAKQKNSP